MASTGIQVVEVGKPLNRIVRFTGLSHDILVHPAILGEPVLTAQPFYYVGDLEYVAKIRFESEDKRISGGEVDYLIDNYLFKLNVLHRDQNAHAKHDRFRFWSDEPEDFYVTVDNRNTLSLTIDAANDPCVRQLRAAEGSEDVDLSDWDIGRSYVNDCMGSFVKTLSESFTKKVFTFIEPEAGRNGYHGRLRIVRPGEGLIDFFQAKALEDIAIYSVRPSSTDYVLESHFVEGLQCTLPVEHINANTTYVPVLLSHYFSGLKEINPSKSFVGFYNVLEYFFGEVPTQSSASSGSEKNHLTALIKHLLTNQEISSFIQGSVIEDLAIMSKDLPTSSGVTIKALNLAGDAGTDVARWLYDIRCAVVHSKKSRNGQATASFEPYSAASELLRSVVPTVRWIAEKAILIEGKVPSASNKQTP